MQQNQICTYEDILSGTYDSKSEFHTITFNFSKVDADKLPTDANVLVYLKAPCMEANTLRSKIQKICIRDVDTTHVLTFYSSQLNALSHLHPHKCHMDSHFGQSYCPLPTFLLKNAMDLLSISKQVSLQIFFHTNPQFICNDDQTKQHLSFPNHDISPFSLLWFKRTDKTFELSSLINASDLLQNKTIYQESKETDKSTTTSSSNDAHDQVDLNANTGNKDDKSVTSKSKNNKKKKKLPNDESKATSGIFTDTRNIDFSLTASLFPKPILLHNTTPLPLTSSTSSTSSSSVGSDFHTVARTILKKMESNVVSKRLLHQIVFHTPTLGGHPLFYYKSASVFLNKKRIRYCPFPWSLRTIDRTVSRPYSATDALISSTSVGTDGKPLPVAQVMSITFASWDNPTQSLEILETDELELKLEIGLVVDLAAKQKKQSEFLVDAWCVYSDFKK